MRPARAALITGTGGYAAPFVARALAADGWRLTGTWYRQPPVLPPTAAAAQLDLCDHRAIVDLVASLDPDAIVHAAAMTDVARCEAEPGRARYDIVESTEALLAARRYRPRLARFIYLSTDLVFDGEEAPYSTGARPSALSVYGRCKAEAERAVLDQGGDVLRVPLLYGPRGAHKPGALFWMVDALRRGEPLTLFSDETRTPLHVDDLGAAVARLLAVMPEPMRTMHVLGGDTFLGDPAPGRIWHLGGPDSLTRVAMGRLVCQKLGVEETRVQPRLRMEYPYPAPRPRDVSLASSADWSTLGLAPRSFAAGVDGELSPVP